MSAPFWWSATNDPECPRTVTPGPIRLIVVPDSRRLDSLTSGRAPSWGAAIALPDVHTILLRADAGDLFQTLRHELAHLALHRRVSVRVPLWFDEGYAGWAAGEWERLGTLELNLSVARGAIPDFRTLDGALRGAPVGDGFCDAGREDVRRMPFGWLARSPSS